MALRIDIVSDVVCPWCVIGYKQLEQALAQRGLAAEIVWHPFELNPALGPEGTHLLDHLVVKYATTREGILKNRARLTEMGRDLGFAFAYTDDMRVYNTFQAHQLLHWAAQSGRQTDLKLALFTAFFAERRNIGEAEVLADVVASIGLDRAEALAVLAEGRFAQAVQTVEQLWRSQGIEGVPAMAFNRQLLVSGAQGVENYLAVLDRLATAA